MVGHQDTSEQAIGSGSADGSVSSKGWKERFGVPLGVVISIVVVVSLAISVFLLSVFRALLYRALRAPTLRVSCPSSFYPSCLWHHCSPTNRWHSRTPSIASVVQ